MGKSIPLATGLVPMAAAVVGTRRGIKRGIQKVKTGDTAEELLVRIRISRGTREMICGELDSQVKDALNEYRCNRRAIKSEVCLREYLHIQLDAFWIRFRIHEAGA